jgi:hypothetical protein
MMVEFGPLGTTVKCKVSMEIGGESSDSFISPLMARDLIIKSGRWTPRGGPKTLTGVGPARPKRSLILDDFADGDAKVKERAVAVARALTDTVARGRIGSLQLMIDGCDTFDKWWQQATPDAVSRLFSDDKHWKTFSVENHKTLRRVLGSQCPFRGPVPTPKEEEEEEEPRKPQRSSPRPN